jgi:phosphoribosylanthranilate isomerase
MTGVKICGINSPAAFDAAVEAGADWVGFVFFPPSPRFVMPSSAAALSGRVAGGPARVGLFVEPDLAAIARVLDTVALDVLQIYGALDGLAAIRARFGLPIWRAVGVSSAADLPTETLGGDRLLLEAKPPVGADRPGGNATTFDWSVLLGWAAPAPWVLAGGLTVDNVATAIRETGAEVVDVSSGVESSKGVKDVGLIRAFVASAKGALP